MLSVPHQPSQPSNPERYPDAKREGSLSAPEMKSPSTGQVHTGAIHSSVAGRTDHLPMHVESGSYVIPADIISAMGEGNTNAGFKVAKNIFAAPFYGEGEPYGAGGNPYGSNGTPYVPNNDPYGMALPKKAKGGSSSSVPIVAAGGEYVIGPKTVEWLGNGSMDHGHKILDDFVKKMRHKTIKTLQKLPGPKRD